MLIASFVVGITNRLNPTITDGRTYSLLVFSGEGGTATTQKKRSICGTHYLGHLLIIIVKNKN